MANQRSKLDFFFRKKNETDVPRENTRTASSSVSSSEANSSQDIESDASMDNLTLTQESSVEVSEAAGPSKGKDNCIEDSSKGEVPQMRKKDKNIGTVPTKHGVRARKRIRCRACMNHPEVVKRFCHNGRIPPLCIVTGTEARSKTEDDHVNSEAHKETLKAMRLKCLSTREKVETIPLYTVSNSQTVKLANRIGKLVIQVYNDAKNQSLSAYSWPSRVDTNKIASKFNFNEPFTPYDASSFDLQYITPQSHDLLNMIVLTDLPNLQKQVDECLAASFRCDASMDRTQKDNEFILLKLTDQFGTESLKYIGLGHVTGRGAAGHLQALKDGASGRIGFRNVLKVANHMTTDGENKNVGQHRGLWKLIDDERAKDELNFPMLKSVCAVHSSALAYKDLCKEVAEVVTLIRKASSISTFFHASAARTTELEELAKEMGLKVRRLPKYFEIRWSEFTSSLIDAILISWRAIINFCQKNDSGPEKEQIEGFDKPLSNKDNLLLMCFLEMFCTCCERFRKSYKEMT